MFALLRGMFALAIWDAPRRRLVLGRDRLGQKPLLYRLDRGRITFASELKALLALPEDQFPRRVDPLALDRYLTYGYVPHPKTILQGVYKLPPAHYAVWHDGRLDTSTATGSRTGRPRLPVREARTSSGSASTLSDAVREQMVADVPLGAFLSGGIDSTIIVGLMQRASSPAGPDLLDRLRRPGLRRDPLRRAGRRATWAPSTTASSSAPGRGRPCRPWPGSSTSRSPTARRCRPGTSPARPAGTSPSP